MRRNSVPSREDSDALALSRPEREGGGRVRVRVLTREVAVSLVVLGIGVCALSDRGTPAPQAMAARPGPAVRRGMAGDLAYSPDGRTLAVTGTDGELSLWDL